MGSSTWAISRVHLGLVPAHPEQLRRREAGQRAVPRSARSAARADSLLDLGALRGGALIVPEDRRAQHAVLRVEQRRARASGRTGRCLRRRASRASSARSVARHQSSGSLLRPAGSGRRAGIPPRPSPGPRQSGAMATALTPVVPTSIPMSVGSAAMEVTELAPWALALDRLPRGGKLRRSGASTSRRPDAIVLIDPIVPPEDEERFSPPSTAT